MIIEIPQAFQVPTPEPGMIALLARRMLVSMGLIIGILEIWKKVGYLTCRYIPVKNILVEPVLYAFSFQREPAYRSACRSLTSGESRGSYRTGKTIECWS